MLLGRTYSNYSTYALVIEKLQYLQVECMTALRFLQSKLYLESYLTSFPPYQPILLYVCLSKWGYICFFQGSAFAHSISPFRKKNPKGLKYWLITIGLSHIWLNVLSKKRKRGLYHVTVKSFFERNVTEAPL